MNKNKIKDRGRRKGKKIQGKKKKIEDKFKEIKKKKKEDRRKIHKKD